MSWTVVWTPRAQRELARVPLEDRQRIGAAVDRLAATGLGDVKKLQGTEYVYRLRVGRWRVLFSSEKPEHILLVLRVVARKDAY